MAERILVAYYSWGENTKAVGDYIAVKTGADTLELKVTKAYPSDFSACVNQAIREGKNFEPELATDIPDLLAYDVIFVGAPCWWGTIANPLRTFLHQNDFTGKTIIPFMTHGTSGLKVQDVKKLCPNSKVLQGCGIFNKYQVSTKINTITNMGNYRSEIDKWIETLNI